MMHAELLPEDKAKIIKDFQKLSLIAMVGDGINDAPALATADIGISMGVSGSALATETGHVILMSNDIRKIPIVVRLARKTRRKIFENIFLAIVTKAAIIALAIAGHPLVWAAVLADVGTCLVVILNSMLLLRGSNVTKSANKHSGSSHDHKHCHSSHKHVKCSSVKRVPANFEKKKGCCGHGDKVHEIGHSVQEKEVKHGCCTHDDHAHEVKHRGQGDEDVHVVHEDIGSKHGCCAHDDHAHEVKHCGHDDDEDVIKLLVQGKGCKDSCCSHDDQVHKVKHCGHDDEDVHVAKHLVQEKGKKNSCYAPKENHGCCGHDDSSSDEQARNKKQNVHLHATKDTQGCCGHASNESHKDSETESQTRRTRSCEIVVKKEHNCCHDQTTHKKNHETGLNHDHVKEYITEEELGKMVRHCCQNQRHVSGCCRSFRKDCCGQKHFGVGFNEGGLSEIVIE